MRSILPCCMCSGINLRLAIGISRRKSAGPSMASSIRRSTGTCCSSPAGKSTHGSLSRNGSRCSASSSRSPAKRLPRVSSWANSVPMRGKTKRAGPCGNMTISFAACICWTTSILHLYAGTCSGRSIAGKITISSAVPCPMPTLANCGSRLNMSSRCGRSAAGSLPTGTTCLQWQRYIPTYCDRHQRV